MDMPRAGYNLPPVPPPTVAALAPPPKACGNCARVKCKCVYRENGEGCERCHRLKKQCSPSTLVRRHKQSKRLDPSRTARLEERFDDLLSFLRSQNVLGSNGLPIPERPAAGDHVDDTESIESESDAEPQPELEPDDRGSSPAVLIPTPGPSGDGSVSAALSTPASASVLTPAWSLAGPEEPSALEAEESLRRFRDETTLFFPFVYIPPYMTASQVREMYPFLWLNIMSTTSASPKRRLALGDQIRTMVFQRIIVDREKSLDLLLGLLAFLAWSHLQRKEKVHNGLFAQLLVLMIYDLGLHKPPAENNPRSAGCRGNASHARRDLTNEDRRAVLGTFLVTSMTSYALNGAPGLSWSSHLDEYVTHLSQRSTLDQDKILVALVRMQLIVDQVQQRASAGGNRELPEIYLSALRSQLQAIIKEDKISPPAANHAAVLQHFHFTFLLIHEASIGQSQPQSNEPGFKRFEIYQQQLKAVKSWLNTFLATPFPLKRCMPFYSFAQLVRCMVCLHRLTTLEDPVWDRAAVRRSVDLIPTLDSLIATFEHLRAATTLLLPDLGEDEAFMWGVVVFQNMKMVWKDEMAFSSLGGGEAGFADGGMQQGGMLTLSGYGFEDTWMPDLFNF